MSKTIYVVRHCKAEGQEPDAKLTQLGMLQADKLAQFLKDKHIDYIISSPFKRAHHTILPLAQELNVEVVLDDRLTERVLSSTNHPNWLEMLKQSFDDLDLYYESGESSKMAMNRIVSLVTDVLNSENKNIVLVSHGNLIALLLKYYDDRIGFMEWQALTNPDLYQLSFKSRENPAIHRIWTE